MRAEVVEYVSASGRLHVSAYCTWGVALIVPAGCLPAINTICATYESLSF